jgi:hypothetical protein
MRASRREAQRLEAREKEKRARRGRAGADTCEGFAQRWTRDYPRPSEATNIHNAERVSKFGFDFASRRLDSIARPEARAWAHENRSRVAATRTMLNDALNDGFIDSNPFAGLRLDASRGRKDLAPLQVAGRPTVAELERLGECAIEVHGPAYGPQFRAMIFFEAFTAERNGELFATCWSDLSGDELHIARQYSSKTRMLTAPKHDSSGLIYVPHRPDALSTRSPGLSTAV